MVRKVNPQAAATIIGIIICTALGAFSVFRTLNIENSLYTRANRILDKMTLEQKVGQLFLMDLTDKKLTDYDREMLKKHPFGNFILMGKNLGTIEETSKYVKDLQNYSMETFGVPAFITIDQEAGSIVRLSENVTLFPGAMSLAATDNPDNAYTISKLMAKELRAAGINLNHAPDTDVNSDPENPIIGDRSFGDDPNKVIDYLKVYIKGHHDSGVMTTAKHYPGHGATKVDSHKALPTIEHNYTEFMKIDIPPFVAAAKNGVDSIMIGHLITPLDEENACTLSKKCVDYLRNEIKYDGILITDSMQMKAIVQNNINESIATALRAGINLICDCGGDKLDDEYYSVINYVVEQVKAGNISQKIIDDSARTIIMGKLKILDATDPSSVDIEADKKEAARVSQESIALVKNENNTIPLDKARKISVIEAQSVSQLSTKSFADLLKEAIPELNFSSMTFNYNPSQEQITNAKKTAADSEVVILLTNKANFVKTQTWLVGNVTSANKNVIGVSIADPYEVIAFKDFAAHVVAFDRSPNSLISALNVILGKFKATGKVPFQY